MLDRDELIRIVEKYQLSHIQSEAEVSSKLIVPLLEWLGYPSEFRAEQFPVYGNAGGKQLRAKPADFILFDNTDFDKNKTRRQKHLDWVKSHSLLIVEAKKPGEMPDTFGQAQFYSHWTEAVGYIYIDGQNIKGFLLGNRTADIQLIESDISSLVSNEQIFLFSFDNIKRIKEQSIDHISSLTPIQYKRKITEINDPLIPDYDSFNLITRYIIPYDTVSSNDGSDSLPLPFDIIEQEKFIILLASAGQGKTYTLYQIFHEAKSHGYHPFFYQLGSLPEENALQWISQDKIIIDERIVFIFDGFDEMPESNKPNFIQTVKAVKKINPNILFVISSRENMYTNQFDNNSLYTLKAITDDEISLFLSSSGINVQKWSEEIKNKNLIGVSTNPFNLAALRDIWIQEGSLPDETHLMKSLIDLRIQTDVCHVYSQSVKQRQKQSEIRKAFQHIALIMQCVHRFYLSNEEINELFDNETQDILLCHGLWNSTNEGLRGFAHNNYREYLAAEALSRLDLTHILGFIANPPNQLTIRPTWINVLSYLADLYRPSDLKNWIFEKQPKLILMFEKDRFTENQRTSVIKQIIDKSKKQDSWILMNHSYMSSLAAYCSTSEAVQYIVDELQQVQTQRHKQNLLRCLSYFPEYYSFEDIIKGIIINIAFNNSEDLYVKCDAFRVMSSHPDLFHDYIDNAVELIRQQVNEYLIYEVIVFIKETGKAEDYIDAVINAYDKYDYYNNHLISLKITTYSILENIQGIEAACKIIKACPKWFRTPNKQKDDIDNLFKACCDIGIQYYSGPNDPLLTELLTLLHNKLRLFDPNTYFVLQNYIEKTHTEELFIDVIVKNQPINRQGYIISQLINDTMVETLIRKIEEGKLEISLVKDIITRLPYNCSYQIRLINAVYFKTQEKITIDPPIDYAKKQQVEHQRFFDSLFDEQLFDNLVNELLDLSGQDSTICEEHYTSLFSATKMEHMNEALLDCYFALQDLFHGNEKIYIRDYRSKIDNWDAFCFHNAEHCIETHSIEIDQDKKQWLTNYCIQYLTSIDLEKAITIHNKRLTFRKSLYSSTKLFKFFSIQCPESLAVKLLSVPPALFDDRNMDHLPECITSQIQPSILREHVIELIHSKKWNRWTAPALIQYCKTNKIMECREEITQYILDVELNDGYTYPALDYLEKLFGIDSLLNDILPYCDNEDLLSNLSARIPNNIPSPQLDKKLWETYESKKDNRWLEALIKHNNIDALREYYKQAKERMTLPDMVNEPCILEVTEAIHEITSPTCIHILIDLFTLSYTPGFIDQEGFGLKSVCWSVIKNIARVDYEATQKALTAAITTEKSDTNTALKDLLYSIKDEQPYMQDTPLDIDFAKQLVLGM